MKISGLTVLKNTVMLDYPFVEAISSALPICDEFVVVIGKSDDNTLDVVQGLHEKKIRIIETEWSEKIHPQDCVLAQQTNIGLHLCKGDWAVYVQANEILHEESLPKLIRIMEEHRDNRKIEALLLERLTFWGDYDHVVSVYPHRFKYLPRILKPYLGTYAVRGAMGFGVFDEFALKGHYPRAIDTGEDIYRYGLVCSHKQVENKDRNAVHMKDYEDKKVREDFFYTDIPRAHVMEYKGTHPKVMQNRIDAFDQNISMEDKRWRTELTWKERQRLLETWFYEHWGVPCWRNKRFHLVGNYAKKDRV
jgi:glycosyltransferase involved in cell wall biosynthesis